MSFLVSCSGGGGGVGGLLWDAFQKMWFLQQQQKRKKSFVLLDWGNVRWEMLHEHFPTHCNRSVMVQMSVL